MQGGQATNESASRQALTSPSPRTRCVVPARLLRGPVEDAAGDGLGGRILARAIGEAFGEVLVPKAVDDPSEQIRNQSPGSIEAEATWA